MLRLPRGELARIRAHAVEAYPEEACGFLVGPAHALGDARAVAHAVPARNARADGRTHHFLIPAPALLEAERAAAARGWDVLGFYHSHPSGVARPSETDRAHAWPWYSYLVVAVGPGGAGDATAWRLAEDRSGFAEEAMELISSDRMEPLSWP